jgi:transcriptional regulator with XRE-family HTH domain
MFRVVENVRRKHLDWVNAILEYKGWSPTKLAKVAGIDPSTLSRFLRSDNPNTRLNSYSIEKIEAVAGIPAFETQAPTLARGLSEDEAEAYEPGMVGASSAAIEALRQGRNGVDPWIMRGRSLELAGYMPGDVLMVDLNAEPRVGDVVCAQVYDMGGRAKTVFRIFEHPFLVAASIDPSLHRPLLIDNRAIMVRGVVVASMRPRRAA